MALVDPDISRAKLERELEAWGEQEAEYRRRGYVIVGRDDLQVDVAFFARLPVGSVALPGMAVCARLDFSNYDVWPPSVTFIDFFSGTRLPELHVTARDFRQAARGPDRLPPNLIVGTRQGPMLCHVGIREYHEHDEHDGDDWLLYRHEPFGTLDAICELIWRTMALNVIGLRTEVQLPPPPFAGAALQVSLVQGDVDAIAAQLRDQAAAAGLSVPG